MNPSGSRRARPSRLRPGGLLGAVLPLLVSGVAADAELPPLRVEPSPGGPAEAVAIHSERTLVVGVEIDRETASLIGYTVKPRPYRVATRLAAPRAHDHGRSTQVEVVLVGPHGERHTRRLDAGPLCLTHGGDEPPHVAGDTVRTHRDMIVLELPEIAAFDQLEIAYHEGSPDAPERRRVGLDRLDVERFDPAAGPLRYADLAFATGDAPSPPAEPSAADVLWPEDLADPDVYHVFGDEAEGQRRINVVIVPDGYRYEEKALMETHASQLVDYFRSKTPYEEHDPFLLYTLVYAYSVESGTDECDCGLTANTAMGTRFPEVTPVCGHGDNRCLSYGSGCDTHGNGNIVAAELRAPYQDETILMVNTARYGGCGGVRATYAAGNSAALEVAVHELAHSLGELDDEYAYQTGCGSSAGEINTSTNATQGAWPEWVPDLGAPRQGAEYYASCLYRPWTDCEMRNLFVPFCAVCNQQWSLITFGHFRVSPTAPVESQSPAAPVSAWVGVPVDFSVATRFSTGPLIENHFTWKLREPDALLPMVVATGTPEHTQVFDEVGTYLLSVEVVADANFVKPSRYGANVDVVIWPVTTAPLAPPPEVSSPESGEPLRFLDGDTLAWEDASAEGAFAYNLYRGTLDGPASGSYGTCLQSELPTPSAVDPTPPPPSGWFYLVAGVNPAGEGPLGASSAGAPRQSASPCE